MQNVKVIAYASCKLKVDEKYYPNHDLELVVVVLELKILLHYLYGVNVDIFTDHKILLFAFIKKELKYLYHPCKANVVADVLIMLYMGSTTHVKEEKRE